MISTFTGSVHATDVVSEMAAARSVRYLVALMVFPPRCYVSRCDRALVAPFQIAVEVDADAGGPGYFVVTRTGNELSARNPLLSR